jgi:hypothetical protein
LEVFDLNFDTEVPITRASPSREKGRSLLGEEPEQMRMGEEEGRADCNGRIVFSGSVCSRSGED